MKYTLIFFIIVYAAGFSSCRPTKKIQTALAKKDTVVVKSPPVFVKDSRADSIALINSIYEKVENRRIDFKTFSAKIKVDYSDKDGKGPDLTVFVRIKKDSVIWLSINATVFSYEAYRVLITRDSVIVLNKKDKEVHRRSLSYLQELSQLPFDFYTLQDLIIGNPIYLEKNVVSFKKNQGNIIMLLAGDKFKHLMTLTGPDQMLAHSKLDDVTASRNRTCDLTYSNYENKSGFLFSTGRQITVAEKSKLDIGMDFKQYSFNENLSFPFAIPRNYKRN